VQIFNKDDKTDTIDDRYWTVRAEPVPEEELNPPENSRQIYVAHVNSEQSNVRVIDSPWLCPLAIVALM
jgi:hypothetical protein